MPTRLPAANYSSLGFCPVWFYLHDSFISSCDTSVFSKVIPAVPRTTCLCGSELIRPPQRGTCSVLNNFLLAADFVPYHFVYSLYLPLFSYQYWAAAPFSSPFFPELPPLLPCSPPPPLLCVASLHSCGQKLPLTTMLGP